VEAWYRSFFTGLWNEVYHRTSKSHPIDQEMASIIQLVGLHRKAAILDVPCGNGKWSLAFANRGHEVTAVDQHDSIFRTSREDGASQKVTWLVTDMRELPWTEKFDLVVCLGGSIGYLGDRGDRDFFAAIYRATKPGGTFLADLHVVETLLPIFQDRAAFRADDIFVTEERHYNLADSEIDSIWTFSKGAILERKELHMRIYNCRELRDRLMQAGFTSSTAYSSWKGDPFDFGSRRLYLLAKK
jgi:SAM-dependent methyltransferase